MKTVRLIIPFILWVSLWLVGAASASERIVIGGLDGLDPEDTTEHYSILLALSGGGARGLTTIGILKAFEERGIKVAAIAGTSIGGIIGGLYASGYSPDELMSISRHIVIDQLLTNAPPRKSMFLTQREERDKHILSIRFDGFMPVIPQGLTAGQRLISLLTTLTTEANYHCGGDFTKLPIPFKTVSTDVVSGEKVVHEQGSLAEAIRATMAFPLAFTGVERGNQLLMDGGMVAPVPVDIVKGMCDSVSFVVAVNTASPLLPKDKLVTPIDIANQVTTIMTADKLKAQLALADFVITPPIKKFNSMDFKYRDTLFAIGYESGKAAADSIISLLQRQRNRLRYYITSLVLDPTLRPLQSDLDGKLRHRSFTKSELIARLKDITITHRLFTLKAELVPEGVVSERVGAVKLLLSAEPMRRLQEVNFVFSGNTKYPDSLLKVQFAPPSSFLSPHVIREGIGRICRLYRADGFDLAEVKNIAFDSKTKTLTIAIDEAIIKRIDVNGNDRTKDWFIRSYFPLQVNQPYSTRRASQGVTNIYSTDLFHQVMVDLVPDKGGAVVKIRVEEKKHRQMRLGWHWDDEYKSEEFLELLDDDIGGIGLQLSAHAQYGRDRQYYFIGVRTNRIFKTYLTSRFRLYQHRLERHLFDQDGNRTGERLEIRTGGEFHAGQQISKLGAVTAGVVAEEIEYRHPRNDTPERFGLRMLTFRSLVETFNRVPFPETGKRHFFELRFAGKYLGGEVEFTRFFTSLEAYFALGKHVNYHPKLAIGLSRSGLPVSEKFYLGGIHSFAGFRTHQLSGDKVFLLSNELRIRLFFRLYFLLRHDMGEVYSITDQIKLRNLRHGVGFFFALDSPLGPVEFGYGIADSHSKRYYLNIGFSF